MVRHFCGFMLLLEVCFVFIASTLLLLEAFACIELNDSARYVYLLELTCWIMIEMGTTPSQRALAPPLDYPIPVVFGNDVLWFRPAPAPPVPVRSATPGAFHPGRVPRKARGG